MSGALTRILDDARAFSAGIARCRTSPFNAADLQDAYNRLSGLRDRYHNERPDLDLSERDALDKVFDHDPYIKGLLQLRQVGEHVVRHKGAVLRTPANQPLYLAVATSAGAAFAAPIVKLPDTSGNLHSTDHLANLEEAEKRIQRAFDRATKKLL
jgi:hypothetical protein